MHHPTLSTGWRALLAATVVAAATTVPLSVGPAAAAPTTDRQQQYAAAATEYGVPAVVLLGVSYLESRWDTNAGTPSTSGGYGPMHLTDARHVAALPGRGHHDAGAEDPRGDDSRPARVPAPRPVEAPAPSTAALQTVDAAATLTGATPEALRTDAGLNIRGGAALLSAYQRDWARRSARTPTRRPGTARWPATPARTAPTPRRPSPTRSSPPSARAKPG